MDNRRLLLEFPINSIQIFTTSMEFLFVGRDVFQGLLGLERTWIACR